MPNFWNKSVSTLFLIWILTTSFVYIPFQEKETANELSFTVLSFNIRYNNKGDGVNAWPNRKEKVAALIQFHDVELAGLQEVLIGQMEDMKNLLPGYGWYGVGRTDGKNKGEFSPVFYLKTRLHLMDSGTFWLSETPDKPSKGWDAALNRIVSWGKFRDKKTQNVFYFFNTHFDHKGKNARKQSAFLILQKVKEVVGNNPVILSGDFNAETNEPPYQVLTDRSSSLGLFDAKEITNMPFYGPNTTYGGGFDEACKPGKKIDYIFIKNNVEVLRHGVLTDSWEGICPSDHMPVMAEIYLK